MLEFVEGAFKVISALIIGYVAMGITCAICLLALHLFRRNN